MVYIRFIYQSGNAGEVLTTHDELLKFRSWEKFGSYLDDLHTLYDVVVVLNISSVCKHIYDQRTKKHKGH